MTSIVQAAAELIRTDPALAHEVHRQLSNRPLGGLTRKQAEVLEFIREYAAENGITPTFGEIAAAVELKSKSGVHRLVTGLEERGFITRMPGCHRSIIIREAA